MVAESTLSMRKEWLHEREESRAGSKYGFFFDGLSSVQSRVHGGMDPDGWRCESRRRT